MQKKRSAPIHRLKSFQDKDFFVIAHNMRSLYNVGSVFRTADAFGVSKIFLTGYTGTPANPLHKIRMSKSALGADEWVPWKYKASPSRLIKDLKLRYPKIKIIALEKDVPVGADLIRPKTISNFKPKFPLVLILGEEVRGVSTALLRLCDAVLSIPMLGKKESLNVSVAFGVAAYQISQKI